ncbi:alpha/beta hydrolase family protein [Nocardioides yefusunii]|uniref:Alpha/beta hydrolase family protein n=1 Tax=Nocardioides yefusunii TaxID=2500546 RepID=A0ABW1QUU1_9ACTN|nr:alpha/beta fold hydrolase [Nocardioides yefusunii]
MSNEVVVRAYRDAVRVDDVPAPLDTVHLTVRHPAHQARTDAERMSGALAPDLTSAPYPVVVVVPGVNVGSAGYTWLAAELVRAGNVVVTYDWVGELFPGQTGLTPGVDISVATPQAYGTAPTTPALRPVLDRLTALNAEGPLAGIFDMSKVALLGHSAGGTVALQSASPVWFPEVGAVITYGSHLMASQMLGFEPGTLLASPATVPVMLLSGTEDGVVKASSIRYGTEVTDASHDPVARTWAEGLPHAAESWLVQFAGAGHLLPVQPEDPTSARGFLEAPLVADQEPLREIFVALVTEFLATHLGKDPAAAESLSQHCETPSPLIAVLRRR